MSATRPGQPIVDKLTAAASALAAGNLEATAALMVAAESACAAAEAAGQRLTAGELAEARAVLGRLEFMAHENQCNLMASLQAAMAETTDPAGEPDP